MLCWVYGDCKCVCCTAIPMPHTVASMLLLLTGPELMVMQALGGNSLGHTKRDHLTAVVGCGQALQKACLVVSLVGPGAAGLRCVFQV